MNFCLFLRSNVALNWYSIIITTRLFTVIFHPCIPLMPQLPGLPILCVSDLFLTAQYSTATSNNVVSHNSKLCSKFAWNKKAVNCKRGCLEYIRFPFFMKFDKYSKTITSVQFFLAFIRWLVTVLFQWAKIVFLLSLKTEY